MNKHTPGEHAEKIANAMLECDPIETDLLDDMLEDLEDCADDKALEAKAKQ